VFVNYHMQNITNAISANAAAVARERTRSIRYDNIHAGGIVTEKNRAEHAEYFLEKQIYSVKLELVFFVLLVVVALFVCKSSGRRQRF
jgi:hypothetical protein